MASPATAPFLAAWRRENVKPALLVEVALTDPTTRTLKLTNVAGLLTPDSAYWEPLIHQTEAVEAPGDYLTTGVDLCSFTFTIAGERFTYQASGVKLGKAMVDYRWQGATVTVWLWELSLTSISDRLQIFKGEILDFNLELSKATVICRQRNEWNGVVTPSYVTRGKFPHAPEKNIGRPLPIIFGYGDARPLRGDWGEPVGGTDRDRFDYAGGAIPTVQGVLVDVGRGSSGEKAKVLFSGHELESGGIGVGTNGCNIFMRSDGDAPHVLTPAGGDIFNLSTGAGFEIPDDSSVAYYVVVPAEVKLPANPADDPRYILDAVGETTYAILDYDANKRNLQIPLNDIVSPGEYAAAVGGNLIMGYKTIGGATNLKLSFRNNITPSELNDAVPASTVPTTMLGGGITAHDPTVAWHFSDCEIQVEFTGVATGVICHVYFIGLKLNFKPRQVLVGRRAPKSVFFSKLPAPKFWGPFGAEKKPIGEVSEVEGEFYANTYGRPDDGSGTYSGFASLTPQHAPDLAYQLLDVYLGQAAANLELGASSHGSFVAARAKLLTWIQRPMEYFFQILEPLTGSDVLGDLARDSLSWIFINRFTDKFSWHVWKSGATVDYDRTIMPADVIDSGYLRASKIASSRIVTSVRIPYLRDAYKGAYASEVRCGPDGSSGGYNFINLRDENMTVVASESDRFDFKDSTGTERNATLTVDAYTPIGFAQHLATRMGVADGTRTYVVAWGGVIVAGYNDKIDFDTGGGGIVATLNAGTYTMEALATEWQARMNAASSGFTVTYSRSTRKLTISRGSAFTLRWNTGTNVATGAATTLGYDTAANDGPGTSFTSDYQREEERFAIGGAKTTLQILWETGVNGRNGTKRYCVELCGFDPLRDTAAGVTSHWAACPKNNREQTLDTAKTKYGGRREHAFDGRSIISTTTARELRNRIIDLNSAPQTVVTFRSSKVPDLERGRVIQFSADFDGIVPFPKAESDGSWAGKKFWVVETRQQAGPERWDTEVTCIEAA